MAAFQASIEFIAPTDVWETSIPGRLGTPVASSAISLKMANLFGQYVFSLQGYEMRTARILSFAMLVAFPSGATAQEPSSSNDRGQTNGKGQTVAVHQPVPRNAAELTEFTAPITIVDASEFLDGGTTYVELRDSKDRTLLLCLSQYMFESAIPPNTLFINAVLPNQKTARLPLSEREARLVVASLGAAVSASLTKEEQEELANLGDLAEHLTRERLATSEAERWSAERWNAAFAADTLRRLGDNVPNYLSADGANPPPWHAAFIQERQAELDRLERDRLADERFKGLYPEEARLLFRISNADPDDWEKLEAEHGRQIAEVVGDPVRLTVISSQALGQLTDGWSWTDGKTRVALHAANHIPPDAFEKALQQIAQDDSALLGAARLFFHQQLAQAMTEDARSKWAIRLAEVVLESALDDEKTTILLTLSNARHVLVDPLYLRVARGELGVERQRDPAWNSEPGIRSTAYLQLAKRGNADVKAEVASLLQTAEGSDKAAYQLCLAFLGDADEILPEHFKIGSSAIGFAAIEAIERSQDARALDVLFESGFDHPWAAVQDQCVLAVQRITGRQWVQENERVQMRAHADEIRQWWDANRDEFLAAHGDVWRHTPAPAR